MGRQELQLAEDEMRMDKRLSLCAVGRCIAQRGVATGQIPVRRGGTYSRFDN